MSPDLPRDLRFRRSIRKSVSSYPRSAPVPHILTLVIILILIGVKRRRHAQGRRFLSSHFTMCSSKFIILALWKSFKLKAYRMFSRYVYSTCILNTKPRGKCFVRYLSTNSFLPLSDTSTVRTYFPCSLYMYISFSLSSLKPCAASGLVFFFNRYFCFIFAGSQQFITL